MTTASRLHAPLLLVLLLAARGPSPAPPQEGGDAPAEVPAAELARARAALQAVADHLAPAHTLRARYEQERTSPLLVEPLVSSGMLLYRRDPACLLFEVTKPSVARIRIDARSYQVHRPDDHTAERFLFEGTSPASALLAAFVPDPEKLLATFALVGLEEDEERATVHLRPREAAARKHVDQVVVTIDREHALVSAVSYLDPEGYRVSLRFRDTELDPELADADALFSQDLPPGTRLLVHRVEEDRGGR